MVARQLRLMLAIELIGYVLLGLWLERRGWSDGEIGLLVVGAFVAARIVLLVIGYGFLARYPSAGTRPGLFGATRMAVFELLAWIVLFSLVQPFERLWMGNDRLRPTDGRPPLLLVHGYRCNRGFWFWLRGRLEAAGWVVATHNLEPLWADIDSYAEGLERHIDAMLAATGAKQVVVVAHSMGGLAARAYFRRHGTNKVARFISLGSPHHGTRIAALALGENGRQMRVGNGWLAGLADAPLPAGSVSIFSRQDNVVMPPDAASTLAGATNIALDGIGHVGMAISPRIAAALREALAQGATGVSVGTGTS